MKPILKSSLIFASPQDVSIATVVSIIDGISGAENKYCVLEVLVNYFNHYDVENDLLEYLSFEEKSYDYDTYSVDSNLTARKVRRAIKKLDKALLALIPDLLPLLENVAFLKSTLDNIKANKVYDVKDEWIYDLNQDKENKVADNKEILNNFNEMPSYP